MAFQKIGILSIGEMGFHWAKLLKGHGVDVLTYDKDRGEVTRKRRRERRRDSRCASMADLVDQSRLDCLHRRSVCGDQGCRQSGRGGRRPETEKICYFSTPTRFRR